MNTFQQQDPTGAEFFNMLLDSNVQQQPVEQQYVDDEQAIETEDDVSNDFIEGLQAYAKETEDQDLQQQIDALREQLALQASGSNVDFQDQELEDQLALAEFYQTPDGEEELMSKYEPNATLSAETYIEPSTKYTPVAESIGARESGGNYQAYTSAGGGEGAVGKYQFRWALHKNWITKLTGVKNLQEFKNSPQAQEKAFAYWDKATLTPTAVSIQKALAQANKAVPSIDEIKKKVHFAGEQGAKDYYLHGKETTDAFGTKTSTYAVGGYAVAFQGGRLVTTTNKEKRKYSC